MLHPSPHLSTCAFVCSQPVLRYFFPVITHLPPNMVSVLLARTGECGKDDTASQLLERGYSIHQANDETLRRYDRIIADRNLIGPNNSLFDTSIFFERKCACLAHAVDASPKVVPAGHAYIHACKRQAAQRGPNKIDKEEHPVFFRKIKELPRDALVEFAYSGPFHLGEWEEKRHVPKEHLRQELEAYLQRSLPTDKPVVAFFEDEVCHLRQVQNALAALAKRATVIIKSLYLFTESPPGTILWPSVAMAPNLLRFAADYILAGYNSGTLASSIMLGLNVIPYYTRLVHKGGRVNGKLARYTTYLPSNNTPITLVKNILQHLGIWIDIENTDQIADLMENAAYWRGYARQLPSLQQKVFGDYRVSGSARKTAELLLAHVQNSSFGEDTVAIALRPEFGKICRTTG